MAGKAKKQVTIQEVSKTNGLNAHQTQHGYTPKRGHAPGTASRHSYHHGSGTGGGVNGNTMFDAHLLHNEGRPLVARERSFVRPQPKTNTRQISEHQSSKRRPSAMTVNTPRGKPAMEIYRPPTLRGSSSSYDSGKNGSADGFSYDSECNFSSNAANYSSNTNHSNGHNNHSNGHNHHNHNYGMNNFQNSFDNGKGTSGLNIHAKEFISSQGDLLHSKSSGNVNLAFQSNSKGRSPLQHSKSGLNLHTKNDTPKLVHFNFSEQKENDPELKVGMTSRNGASPHSVMPPGIKRSKSLSAADFKQNRHATSLPSQVMTSSSASDPLAAIGSFQPDIHSSISKALNDPNCLSARQLMEAARHVFCRAVEASRLAEAAARICSNIIQQEKSETFLETLLNTCQEYFQERDRLLRIPLQPAPYPGYVASNPRWIAFMAFLNEMYTQLKRRNVQLMNVCLRNSDTSAGTHLLNLLTQCCQVCLSEPTNNSLAETECLFFVLTSVGKDMEAQMPGQMCRVMGAARDAFLASATSAAVRKTLLQLIEMHAARWQMPAQAVLYYYPSSR